MVSFRWHSGKGKIINTENKSIAARNRERMEGTDYGIMVKGLWGTFEGVGDAVYISSDGIILSNLIKLSN